MSNELVANAGSNQLVPMGSLAVGKYADDSAFGDIATGATFLPRIMLMQASSEPVKDDKAKQGHHVLVQGKDQYIDLTKDVIIVPLAWRPKAMDMSNLEHIITVYKHDDPEFKRIMVKSEEQNSNCMYGPEYLVWVPTVQLFASYFMSSKTSRRAAPHLKALLGRAASLKSEKITAKKFSWFGPVIIIYSQSVQAPPLDQVNIEVEKFNNPPEKESEAAPADERAR
jgi:hypothetical protein